ncbi:hypothetical protein HG530_011025 [Fusarium avenaceum]|nr:hypothetical protein HG530_011025 [Fusarium avenaceum]
MSLQDTDAEHHSDTNLLSPVKVHLLKLGQWNAHDPKVESNVDSSAGNGNGVDISASTSMLAIPLSPEVVDRLALEDGDKDKDQAEKNSKGHSSPKKSSHAFGREDAQVEAEHRELEKCLDGEVKDSHDKEEHSEVGDLARCQSPDIPSHAVGGQTVRVDCDGGDGEAHCYEDE